MFRACLYIIVISLVMIGCNDPDTAKKLEQKSENVDQGLSGTASKTSNSAEALMKEIQTIAKSDFRKAKWGMPRNKVKLTEADDPIGENDSDIIYSRKVAGMDALMGYVFVEDKLVKAKYMFQQQHSDSNAYITDYNNLKKALETTYGKAKREKALWSNDLYTNIPAEWGEALSLGYLTYLSYWNTKNTQISLLLKGENYKIDFWLEYKSMALANLEEKVSKKQ